MKFKWKLFFKTIVISSMCCAVFIGFGYLYLSSKMKTPAENEVSSIPYYQTPQNAGVLFDISGEKTLLYLDFESLTATVILAENFDDGDEAVYGYSIDYTVTADYSLLSGIIDILGGIELEYKADNLIYTGVQVVELLSTTPPDTELKKDIISKVLSQISQNGFSKNDFLYIIEHSSTNLTVPDCYFWQDSISEICKTVRILCN